MATERLAMQQVREILRQKLTLKRSHRDVMAALGVSMGVICSVVGRAAALGLDWEAAEALSDEEVRARAETFGIGVGYAVQNVDLPAYAGSVNLRHGRVEPSPGATSLPAPSAIPGTGAP